MNSWRKHWGKIFIVVVVVAIVLPPALFGEPRKVGGETGGDTWRNFILDFQTLIGGLLAVFAAWWTVDTMEATDKSAERRHEQLFRQQVRPDALKVERFVTGELPNFKNILELLRSYRIPTDSGYMELIYGYFDAAEMLERTCVVARKLEDQPLFKECRPLFGGQLLHSWRQFERSASQAELAAGEMRRFREQNRVDEDTDLQFLYRQARVDHIQTVESLPSALGAAIPHLEKVIEELDALAEIYGAKQ